VPSETQCLRVGTIDEPTIYRVSPDSNRSWPATVLLGRLIANLVSNAIKYNEPGGWVEVEVTGEPAGPALTVRNTGPHVPAEPDQAKVRGRPGAGDQPAGRPGFQLPARPDRR
jgi:signal transduction histidine kinase